METISQLIINNAKKCVGQIEKPGNMGFVDPVFDADFRKTTGFEDGNAWCDLANEYVWKKSYEVYNPKIVSLLDVIFSKSAVKTFDNFKKSLHFKDLVTKTPIPGALVFWQLYKDGIAQWQGHTAVFYQFVGGKLLTFDGNTNENGGREGYGYFQKNRPLDYFNNNGLRIIGMVNPKI